MSEKMEVCTDVLDEVDDNKLAADIQPEAYNYWIHCNHCFEMFYRKELSMYLLSCQHVLCQNCVQAQPAPNAVSASNSLTYKCIKCARIVRACMIGNEMPRHLKELFHPTPWLSDLPIERIHKFQEKHRAHLVKAMNSIEAKATALEQTVLEAFEMRKEKEKELLKLKHENMKLERQVRPLLAAYKEKKKLKARQMQQKQQATTNSFASVSSFGRRVAENRSLQNQHFPASNAHNRFVAGGFPGFNCDLNKSDNGSVRSSVSERKNPNETTFMGGIPKNSFFL